MTDGGWGGHEPGGRFAAGLAVAGAATAIGALLLAGAAGEPYLGTDGVNPWVVVFAAGLLTGLIAFPFGFEVRLRARYPDRDRRWELSMLVWGAVSIAIGAVAFAFGFDTATLGGAAALIAAIEVAIVIVTIAAWLVAGG